MLLSATQRYRLVIPKLEDPDSCYVRRHWDIHCKNVRRSNGIWAPCSGADDVADESMSPQFGIRGCELSYRDLLSSLQVARTKYTSLGGIFVGFALIYSFFFGS